MDPRALAQQLGQAIKETPEYRAVQAAQARVDEHEAAKIMLADFKTRQEAYRKSLIEGKASKEEADELRKLAGIVGYNPYLRELLSAEARLAELVLGLQQDMVMAAGLAESAGEGKPETDAEGS